MKYKMFIILSVFVILIFVSTNTLSNNTYSNYKKEFNIDINSHSANLICDAKIDNPGTYISKDGWAYFKVVVKNYDSNDNISKVPIKYNVTITNENDSNAVYRYLDENGNSNDFASTIITHDYIFSANTKQNQVINIEVKTDSMKSEEVDFKVDVNCYQTEK